MVGLGAPESSGRTPQVYRKLGVGRLTRLKAATKDDIRDALMSQDTPENVPNAIGDCFSKGEKAKATRGSPSL
jgi:hypothetical protein